MAAIFDPTDEWSAGDAERQKAEGRWADEERCGKNEKREENREKDSEKESEKKERVSE